MLVVHIPSWFPDAERPLNGNFILRQIETVGEATESIILHHTAEGFEPPVPENIHFHAVHYQNRNELFNAYLTEFKNIIKKYGKPDLIHLHVALPLGIVATRIAKKYHIPLIISEHWSIYQPMNRESLRWYAKWALRYIYRHASHVTAVSQNLLDNISATVPAAAKKTQTVVGNVVNPDIFSLKSRQGHDRKSRFCTSPPSTTTRRTSWASCEPWMRSANAATTSSSILYTTSGIFWRRHTCGSAD